MSFSIASSSSGKAGNVTVSTLNGSIDLPSYVFAYSISTLGSSQGGNVDFSAINGDIFVLGVDTGSHAGNTSAKGGNIRLLAINGDIQIESLFSGSISGQGNSNDGGSISVISTGGSIFLNASPPYSRQISSISASKGNSGHGGNILLSARDGDIVGYSLDPFHLASFSTSKQGTSGNGGNITLEAKNRILGLEILSLSSTGKAGDIQIQGFGDLSVTSLSILSDLSSVGGSVTSQSGRIIFTSTGNLTLSDSRIASTTVGSNPADDITFTSTGTTTLNNSFITSQTSGAGDGADITVTAQSLNLLQGSQIATSTSGSGQAGDITILVDDQLWLSGAGAGLFSSATPGATGGAGNITIDPDLVLIEEGATIAIDNQGTGQGGDIDLVAGDLVLRNQGAITTNTTSPQGGNILLKIRNALSLQGNSVISTSAGTPQVGGSGGNITITASAILSSMAENSDIVANAFNGTGGNIILNTQEMVGLQRQPQRTANSDITSSGNFNLNRPAQLQLNPSNQNSEAISQPYFSSQAIDATTALTQSCTPASSSASANGTIVEAQGWVVQPDGSIELVGQTANPLSTEACTF
jgi:large exoprotein involved in heme utilization and adhesion